MKKIVSFFMFFLLMSSFIFTGCKKSSSTRDTADYEIKNESNTDSEDIDLNNNENSNQTGTNNSTGKDELGSSSSLNRDNTGAGGKETESGTAASKADIGNPSDEQTADSVEEKQTQAETANSENKNDKDTSSAGSISSTDKGITYSAGKDSFVTDSVTSSLYSSTKSQFSWDTPAVPDTEEYSEFEENGFLDTTGNPLSTFSIDVDTASYANIRKNINNGMIPDAASVRIEEMLNYFFYDYQQPTDGKPFSIHTEIGKCPWNEEHYLMMVGIQGKDVDTDSLPKSNLVFLIDVSGSMDEPDKLPLIKKAFARLVKELGEKDKVSVVVYAGDTGVVLDSVRGNKHNVILDAIESLSAGGSTAGASGLELAYKLAEKNFMHNGNNRVILATDGDFNVGPSSMEALEEIITEKRESGIYLSVMGFGTGNIKDNKMELLADKGNGNYSYIDTVKEAERVLVKEMAGTLLTIAKDVKIQLEFNPYSVETYRLIGYENRALENHDFKNDSVDAGELGAGHSVTAVYEIVPGRAQTPIEDREDLKYQSQGTVINKEYKNEISEIRLCYKEPKEETSKEIRQTVTFTNTPVKGFHLSDDFYFAAAVVEFGMLLRNSDYLGNTTVETILELAEKGLNEDTGSYRSEFIGLVETYQEYYGYRW